MKNIVYINPKRIFEVNFSNGDNLTVHAAYKRDARFIAISNMKITPMPKIISMMEIKIDRNI